MQMKIQIIICVLFVATLDATSAIRCNREPENVYSPKSIADNPFHLEIIGNPNKYVPGRNYTVSLQSQHIRGKVRPTFKRFMIVVEPSYDLPSSRESNVFGNKNVGSLSVIGDTLALHSKDCPNAIIHISTITKSEVQATWTAPPPGNGCVVFRATVVEDHDVWYMDDGPLSLILCEAAQENNVEHPEFVYPCCACDEATYELTFEGLWSKPTHPKGYPPNEWITGFSDLIGASHSADYRFWEYGNVASEGLRQVAELGSTQVLENEIMTKSGNHVRTVIKAIGLSYPNVTGRTYSAFRVDPKNHLVSIVSMIDPSPDWIVGVSGLNLCLQNCSWAEHKILDLYPWDVGTDSGITYTSPDLPTSPRQTISPITSDYPNDPRSPFYDSSGTTKILPLARLYLNRQRLYKKECEPTGSSEDNVSHHADCALTKWSEWSYCSVTCGRGVRHRHRSYVDTTKAYYMACDKILAGEDICYGAQLVCGPTILHPEVFDPVECAVTHWSPWSNCLGTCGIGEKTRTRSYRSKQSYERCSLHPDAPLLEEKKRCRIKGIICDDEPKEGDCPVSEWSAWSPCSSSCGKGKSVRMRFPIAKQETDADVDTDNILASCSKIHTTEDKDCISDIPSCEITPQVYKMLCKPPMDEGTCDRQNERWYYDAETETCNQFNYTGCLGNKNNFLTEKDCESTCKGYMMPEMTEEEATTMAGPFNGAWPSSHILDSDTTTYGLIVSTLPTYNFEQIEPVTAVDGPVSNCVVSRWSKWSKCSVSCGSGFKTRSRTIEVYPRNGGTACPQKLYKRKKCNKTCASEIENTTPASTNFGYNRPWLSHG